MRAVPANGTRDSLFRGAGGEEQYAKLAKLARDGDLPTDLVAGADLDDSIRVIKLERASRRCSPHRRAAREIPRGTD